MASSRATAFGPMSIWTSKVIGEIRDILRLQSERRLIILELIVGRESSKAPR
jgi:hypothetical protein